MPASPRKKRKRSPKPTRPSRLYAGAIVAIAVFVFGSAVWRAPVTGFRAQAVVSYRTAATDADAATPPATATLEQLTDAALSTNNVRTAAETVLRPNTREEDQTASTIGDGEVADIRRRVAATGAWEEKDRSARVTLSYVDPDRNNARKFVNALAGQFVSQFNQPDEAEKRRRTADLETATKETEAIRSRLDALVTQHKELTKRQPESSPTPPPDRGPAPAPETTPKKTPKTPTLTALSDTAPAAESNRPLNPDWVRLRDHVAELKQRQTELAVTRTEAHPQMQQLVEEIEEFSAVFARTSKYSEVETLDKKTREPVDDDSETGLALTFPLLAEDPPGFDVPAPEAPASDDGVPPISGMDVATNDPIENGETVTLNAGVAPTEAADAAKIAAVKRQLNSVRAELEAAERTERELAANVKLFDAPRASVVEPAERSVRVGGQLSTSRLLQLLGAALGLGAIAALLLPAGKASRVASGVSDAEQLLGIPAVGSLSGGDSKAKSPGKRSLRRGMVRLVTTAAELALIAVVVFFVTAMLLDRSVAAQYIDDPVHAVHQTFELASQHLPGG